MRRACVAAVAAAFVLSCPRVASADGLPSCPGAGEHFVTFDTQLDPESAETVTEVLEELLARVRVTLCAAAAGDAGREAPLATLRIRPDASRLLVRIYDPEGDRVLWRSVEAPDGVGEIVREEVAHIVHSTVEALLTGVPIGVRREESEIELAEQSLVEARRVEDSQESEPTRGASAAAPTEEANLEIPMSVGWWAAMVATESIDHGPFLRLGLAPAHPCCRVELVAEGLLPTERSTQAVSFTTYGARIGLGAHVDVPVARGAWFVAGLDALVELRGVAPGEVTESSLSAAEPSLTPLFVTRFDVGARFAASPLWFQLLAGVAVDWFDTRYTITERTGEPAVSLDPWRVQPTLSLSVGLTP